MDEDVIKELLRPAKKHLVSRLKGGTNGDRSVLRVAPTTSVEKRKSLLSRNAWRASGPGLTRLLPKKKQLALTQLNGESIVGFLRPFFGLGKGSTTQSSWIYIKSWSVIGIDDQSIIAKFLRSMKQRQPRPRRNQRPKKEEVTVVLETLNRGRKRSKSR